jgi:GLPGLI family protein
VLVCHAQNKVAQESNNSNQMIIKRENRIETEKTHSRFLIRNDSIFESRFGMNPNQKMVYSKPNFDWKITDKQKKIGRYNAYLATMSYYGREFEAWFTYDLPIAIGPYIFGGLPGLILGLEDTQKHFQLYLKSIEEVESMPVENISAQPVTISLIDGIKLQHKAIDKMLLPLKMLDAENMIAATSEINELRDVILERIDYK